MKSRITIVHWANLFVVATLLFAAAHTASAQDRLKTMPGYEQFQKMNPQIRGSVKLGSLSVTWKDDGKAFEYRKDGKSYRYDIAAGKATEIKAAGNEEGQRPQERRGRRNIPGGPVRGR